MSKQTTVRLPTELADEADAVARVRGTSVNQLIVDSLRSEIERVMGPGNDLTACFSFVNSKKGQAAMEEARLTPNHKDLLLYFCSLILDPEGHRKWAEGVRDKLTARERARPGFTYRSR